MKVPSGQTLWMTKYDGKGNPVWIITSDSTRTKYYLYKWDGEKLLKVKIGKSPKDFENEIGRV